MRLCVFCGSRHGRNERYREVAAELGRDLAERKIGVVYGGGDVGLMGTLADAALAAGGEVLGVIPRMLVEKEVAHQGITELHVVETMLERKERLAELSDAFLALPGGLGTMDELFEVLTWAQLEVHDKPSGLLNLDGYYDDLVRLLDRFLEQDFVTRKGRELLAIERELPALLKRLLPQVY